MIAYSVEAAKNAGIFDRIIVSTDSKEIAAIAKDFGAEIPFMRPVELADNFAGTDAVILHALKWLIKDGEIIDYICCIYATAPFVKAEYIIKGYNLLRDPRCRTILLGRRKKLSKRKTILFKRCCPCYFASLSGSGY